MMFRHDSLLHRLAAVFHQQPDGGRSRVELGHMIFVHNLPHTTNIWVCRKSLKLKHTHTQNHQKQCNKYFDVTFQAGELDYGAANNHYVYKMSEIGE